MGYDLTDPLWSARLLRDDPGAIVDAHLAFLRAGAQVVTTASYQASFDGFAAAGIGCDEAARLMRLSVDLAREAVERHEAETGERALVAASVGPYGAALADGSEYRGRYGLTVRALRDWHAPRFEVLADEAREGRVDLLALETIPDIDEAAALTGLVAGTGLTVWLSFTVEGDSTRAGQPSVEAFSVVRGVDEVAAVGVNCCAPADVLGAVREVRRVTGLPAVVYPNSGEEWDATHRCWTPPRDPASRVEVLAPAWIDAGAGVVGGCCRVTPAQIAATAARVTG